MSDHREDLFELGQLHGEIEAAARCNEEEATPYARTLLAVLDGIGRGQNVRGTLLTARQAWRGDEAR